MTYHFTYTKECPVYPGEYVPPPEKEKVFEELITAQIEQGSRPAVNMDEFIDCFKIQVMLPGIKQEDIFIYVHDGILSLVVVHQIAEKLQKEILPLHEFDRECLERHILLPQDADAEFASAEYRQGILHIYIPKSELPSKACSKQIVVY